MKMSTKRIDKKHKRRLEALRELVEEYFKNFSPVSSEQICRNLGKAVSPATVRNTLAELDELEWTAQPHSSSGRVPLWKAYRTYVDMLRKSDFHDRDYERDFEDGLSEFEMSYLDIAPALQSMASIISDISLCCGVVLSPRFENDFIRQVKLLPLDNSRVLVVLISDFGLVKTEIMQLNRKIGIFSQRRIEDYLNERLHSGSGRQEFPMALYDDEEKAVGEEVYSEIVLKYLINLQPEKSGEVFVEGIGKIFNHAELQAPNAAKSVLSFFENRSVIVALMREAVKSRKILVRIGDELNISSEGNLGFCIIAAPYELNSMNIGAVGLIGPMRMNYRKLIPLISQAAEFLTRRFSISFRKPRIPFDRDIPFKVISQRI
jgi:heat-inducible transcriptional repressor